MNSLLKRQSPIQYLFDPSVGQWGELFKTSVVLTFDAEEVETKALQTLALCDISVLPKLGLKGPDAADWLHSQSIILPEGIYQTRKQSDGSLVVQLSSNEFLLEDGWTSKTVQSLSEKIAWGQEGVTRVERQEASFLLTGSRSVEVLAQTCAINFREAPLDRFVMTRVAGTSCSVLPTSSENTVRYQIWVDATYAVSLWESLMAICQELGGSMIGIAAISDCNITNLSK